MRSALIDSAVPLHADGRSHPLREPCRRLIGAAGEGAYEAHASVELLQEYVHVARRNGKPLEKIEHRVGLLQRALRLHPFGENLLPPALALLREYPNLQTRDAIHLATALDLGIELIVSPDRHFDRITEIERIDPLDEDAVAELIAPTSSAS